MAVAQGLLVMEIGLALLAAGLVLNKSIRTLYCKHDAQAPLTRRRALKLGRR